MKLTFTLSKRPTTKMALLLAGALFWMAASTIFGRLNVEANGTIIESWPGTGARHSTWYKIQKADGSLQSFVAGPTDASLPRDLIRGTSIEKSRWDVGYTIDHHYQPGFPRFFYGAMLAVSLVLFLSSFRFRFT